MGPIKLKYTFHAAILSRGHARSLLSQKRYVVTDVDLPASIKPD